jgi:hypothetical protein
MSWTMRQRLTLLLTCSMRTRRRAMRRFAAFCARVRARPRGFPRRHDDLHLVERERQEAEILEQPTARGQGVRGGIGNPLIVGTARVGLTQKEDRERGVDQEYVFDRVALFLAAIIARLLNRILGTPDAAFGPIVPKRGEADTGADAAAGGSDALGGASVGLTMAAASALVTPRRLASSVTDRVGASPSARSVARRTTRST